MGEGLTRLRLEHGDLAGSPLTWANVKDGWVYVLDGLKTAIETGESLPPLTAPMPKVDDADGEWHRSPGDRVQQLDVGDDRGRADRRPTTRRCCAAPTRRRTTGPARCVVARPTTPAAAWLLAKVQLLVGQPELSLRYADQCMSICEQNGLADFDLAYAHEARARALKALGDDIAAGHSWDLAKSVPIADAEDQAILDADLAVAL